MLLAAGRGERLKPLTDTLPKPLLQVGSKTLIENNIECLRDAGVEEIVINVCYRAKQIMEVVGDGERFGVKITFSFEPEQPLGTGGGVFQALRFLGDEPFIILSSDIWTDYPFEKLTLLDGKAAHLIMVENPPFHSQGDFSIQKTGLLDATSKPKLTYGNISAVHPKLFRECMPGTFSLVELLLRGMESKEITGELYQGKWFNVGTVEELTKLEKSLA